MRRAALLFLLGAPALQGAPALAQAVGTHIGMDVGTKDGPALMDHISKCVVKRQPRLSDQWLQSLPGSSEEEKVVDKLSDDFSFCMEDDRALNTNGIALGIGHREFRRAVALASLNHLFPVLPASPPLDSQSKAWFWPQLAALPPGGKADTGELGVDEFGHCMATGHWSAVRAFLASAPQSAEESGALGALLPFLAPCLPAQVTVKFDRPSLRGILGEAAYHVLTASPATRSQ
jgi:hypothetical protein